MIDFHEILQSTFPSAVDLLCVTKHRMVHERHVWSMLRFYANIVKMVNIMSAKHQHDNTVIVSINMLTLALCFITSDHIQHQHCSFNSESKLARISDISPTEEEATANCC